MIELFLAEAGNGRFQVETVGRLSEAIERLPGGDLDVILLDLSLPDSFGMETFRQVYQHAPELPIVVLSGLDNSELALEAVQEGAQDYLVKGDALESVLVRSVRYAIERFRANEQLRQREQHLRLLTEQLPAFYWTTDLDLNVTSASSTGVLGLQNGRPGGSSASVNLNDHFAVTGRDAGFIAAHLRAAAGESVSFDFRQDKRIFHVHVEPFRHKDGRIRGTIGSALDITDQMLVELELRITRQIQEGLRPKHPPRIPGFDIAGASHACAAAGGDYFDFLTFPDGSTGFVICDVGGNGLGPALLMAQTRAYLRALSQTHIVPGRILFEANRFLCADASEQRLVALFLARVAPTTRQLTYAAAGHQSFLLRADGTRLKLRPTGIPLNITGDVPFETIAPLQLAPDDIVLLYTDGIVECSGAQGEPFGNQRMLDLVWQYRDAPAEEVVGRLIAAVREYAPTEAFEDDMTAVVIKVGPPVERPHEPTVESFANGSLSEACAANSTGSTPSDAAQM